MRFSSVAGLCQSSSSFHPNEDKQSAAQSLEPKDSYELSFPSPNSPIKQVIASFNHLLHAQPEQQLSLTEDKIDQLTNLINRHDDAYGKLDSLTRLWKNKKLTDFQQVARQTLNRLHFLRNWKSSPHQQLAFALRYGTLEQAQQLIAQLSEKDVLAVNSKSYTSLFTEAMLSNRPECVSLVAFHISQTNENGAFFFATIQSAIDDAQYSDAVICALLHRVPGIHDQLPYLLKKRPAVAAYFEQSTSHRQFIFGQFQRLHNTCGPHDIIKSLTICPITYDAEFIKQILPLQLSDIFSIIRIAEQQGTPIKEFMLPCLVQHLSEQITGNKTGMSISNAITELAKQNRNIPMLATLLELSRDTSFTGHESLYQGFYNSPALHQILAHQRLAYTYYGLRPEFDSQEVISTRELHQQITAHDENHLTSLLSQTHFNPHMIANGHPIWLHILNKFTDKEKAFEILNNNHFDLHYADTLGNMPIHLACSSDAPDSTIRFLLQKGARLDCLNASQKTPFQQLIKNKRTDLCQALALEYSSVSTTDIEALLIEIPFSELISPKQDAIRQRYEKQVLSQNPAFNSLKDTSLTCPRKINELLGQLFQTGNVQIKLLNAFILHQNSNQKVQELLTNRVLNFGTYSVKQFDFLSAIDPWFGKIARIQEFQEAIMADIQKPNMDSFLKTIDKQPELLAFHVGKEAKTLPLFLWILNNIDTQNPLYLVILKALSLHQAIFFSEAISSIAFSAVSHPVTTKTIWRSIGEQYPHGGIPVNLVVFLLMRELSEKPSVSADAILFFKNNQDAKRMAPYVLLLRDKGIIDTPTMLLLTRHTLKSQSENGYTIDKAHIKLNKRELPQAPSQISLSALHDIAAVALTGQVTQEDLTLYDDNRIGTYYTKDNIRSGLANLIRRVTSAEQNIGAPSNTGERKLFYSRIETMIRHTCHILLEEHKQIQAKLSSSSGDERSLYEKQLASHTGWIRNVVLLFVSIDNWCATRLQEQVSSLFMQICSEKLSLKSSNDERLEMYTKIVEILATLREKIYNEITVVTLDSNRYNVHTVNYLKKYLGVEVGVFAESDIMQDGYHNYGVVNLEVLRQEFWKQYTPKRIVDEVQKSISTKEITDTAITKAAENRRPVVKPHETPEEATARYMECMYDEDYNITPHGLRYLLHSFGFITHQDSSPEELLWLHHPAEQKKLIPLKRELFIAEVKEVLDTNFIVLLPLNLRQTGGLASMLENLQKTDDIELIGSIVLEIAQFLRASNVSESQYKDLFSLEEQWRNERQDFVEG